MVKHDLGDQGLNDKLRQLDRWLKAELARGGWDVEAVEVKGHAPEFGWGCEKYELLTYRSGQLAKLPREAMQRADELMATTRMTVSELGRLTYMKVARDPAPPISASVPASGSVDLVVPVAATEPVMSDGDRQATGTIAPNHPGASDLAPSPATTSARKSWRSLQAATWTWPGNFSAGRSWSPRAGRSSPRRTWPSS